MAKQVTVGWVDPVDTTNADHIEVWRKTGVGGTYAQIGGDIALGVQTYVDQNGGSGLSDSTDYYYDVRVYDTSDGYVSTVDNIVISGGSIIIYEQTFDGTSIPSGSTVTNPNSATMPITFDNQFQVAMANEAGTAFTNFWIGDTAYDMDVVKSVAFDIVRTDQSNQILLGLIDDNTLATSNNIVSIQPSSNSNNVVCNSKVEGVGGGAVGSTTVDISTVKTFKISLDSGNVYFEFWNGSAWVNLRTVAHVHTANYYPFITAWNVTGASGTVFVDNFVITNALYSTQRP